MLLLTVEREREQTEDRHRDDSVESSHLPGFAANVQRRQSRRASCPSHLPSKEMVQLLETRTQNGADHEQSIQSCSLLALQVELI